jgi:hypothetical protein
MFKLTTEQASDSTIKQNLLPESRMDKKLKKLVSTIFKTPKDLSLRKKER